MRSPSPSVEICKGSAEDPAELLVDRLIGVGWFGSRGRMCLFSAGCTGPKYTLEVAVFAESLSDETMGELGSCSLSYTSTATPLAMVPKQRLVGEAGWNGNRLAWIDTAEWVQRLSRAQREPANPRGSAPIAVLLASAQDQLCIPHFTDTSLFFYCPRTASLPQHCRECSRE